MSSASAAPLDESASAKPARSARTPWYAWAAILGTAAAGAVALDIVDTEPVEDFGTQAELFLPPDGAVEIVSYDNGPRFIRETAIGTGARFVLDQPSVPANAILQTLDLENPGALRFMRVTWTDTEGVVPQITNVYRISEDGVSAVMSAGGYGGGSRLYDPPMAWLPADLAPGVEWSSEGASLPFGLQDYRFTARADAGEPGDGCLEILSETSYADPPEQGGAVIETTTGTEIVCRGLGSAGSAFDGSYGPGTAVVSAFEGGALDVSLEPVGTAWPEAEEWTDGAFDFWIVDPLWGETEVQSITDGGVVTASGTAVFISGTDAFAYTVEGRTGTRSWIAHPGGQLLRHAAIGDAVLVSSTRRQVTAYDHLGRRAWQASFPDVVIAPPVADGAGGVVVAAIDGTVARFELATGEETWRVNRAGEIMTDPVLKDGTVYYSDRDGLLVALDAATGELRWSAEDEPANALLAGDGVVAALRTLGSIAGFDAATGEKLWDRGLPDAPLSGTVLDGGVLVALIDTGIMAFDTAGRELWARAGLDLAVAGNGDRAVAVGASGEAVLLDAAGTELRSWQLPLRPVSITYRLVATPQGALVVGTDMSVYEIGAP